MQKRKSGKSDILANPVKALREHFGWTQEQLARELDISVRTVAHWEQDRPPRLRPGVERLVQLMKSAGLRSLAMDAPDAMNTADYPVPPDVRAGIKSLIVPKGRKG